MLYLSFGRRLGGRVNRLRTILIVVVASVWAANFAAPVFISDYAPPAEVHLIFMAVIATLLKTGDGSKDDSNSK